MTTKKEYINILLNKFVLLRREYKKTQSPGTKKEYDSIQNLCIKSLEYLVDDRTKRYKNFSNYNDLRQDGRLALCMALQSYEPEKGNFYWWANKYIKTKISREANRHSAIKIPLKRAKKIVPHKVSTIPVIIDTDQNILGDIEQKEKISLVKKAIKDLPDDQRSVVELFYGIQNNSLPIGKICKELKIKKEDCMNLLAVAEINLKNSLENVNEDYSF